MANATTASDMAKDDGEIKAEGEGHADDGDRFKLASHSKLKSPGASMVYLNLSTKPCLEMNAS